MSLKYLHGIYLFLAKVGRRNNPSHVLDVRRALIYVSEYLPPPLPFHYENIAKLIYWLLYVKINTLYYKKRWHYNLIQNSTSLINNDRPLMN